MLIGWLGNVTIGVWFLRAGVEVITLILLAALVMRAAADPEEPLRLPLPPAFIALALSILGAIIAVQHMSAFVGQITGIDDWICQLLYVAGVVVVVVGAGIGSARGFALVDGGPEGDPAGLTVGIRPWPTPVRASGRPCRRSVRRRSRTGSRARSRPERAHRGPGQPAPGGDRGRPR